MKKLLLFISIILASGFLFGQSQIQLWDFENGELSDWAKGDGDTIFVSTEIALSGSNSLALVASNSAANIDLINDAFKNLNSGDIITFNVYVPADAIGAINGLQVFWQDTESWEWNSQWFNGSDMVPDSWNAITYTIPEVLDPLQRIGLQMTGLAAEDTPTIYVDDISIARTFAAGDLLGSWDFENMMLGDWVKGNDGDTILVSDEQASGGIYSAKVQSASDHTNIEFQNDVIDYIETGDTIRFDVFVSAEDQANVNGLQIFWQDEGDSWAWNSEWKNGSDLSADEWLTITFVYPEIIPPLQRIGFQLVGTSAEVTPAIYLDNIQLIKGGEKEEEEIVIREVVGWWSFEDESLGNWGKGPDGDTIIISNEQASDGTFSAKIVSADNHVNIEFQNDEFENVDSGDTIMMDVFVTADNLALINGLQIFWQDDGDSWAWNAEWVGASNLVADEWTTLTFRYPDVIPPLNRIGLQMVSLSASDTPEIYVDNIIVLGTPLPPATEAAAITLEAEDAILGSDYAILSDDDETYITPQTNFIETSFPGSASKVATFTVDFHTSGTYDLYAKINVGPAAAEDDSFYAGTSFGEKDTISGTDWSVINNIGNIGVTELTDTVTGGGTAGLEVYKWLNISDLTGVQFTVSEDALTQTFQIGAREDGLKIDKIAFGNAYYGYTVEILENELEGFSVPIIDPGAAVSFESEEADLGADFAIGTDETDDETIDYIEPMTNFLEGITSRPGTADKVHTYSIKLNFPGNYNLYARVNVGPGAADDDSFYAANGFGEKDFDSDGDWIVVNNFGSTGYTELADTVAGNGTAGTEVYKWINVSALTGVTYDIAEGELEQAFQLGAREDGLKIDKIAFGNSSYVYSVEDLNKGRVGSLQTSTKDYFTNFGEIDAIYPTPFEVQTNIEFHLDQAQKIYIDVYNSNGLKVARLGGDTYSTGIHTITWTPDSSMSGGIYYMIVNSKNSRLVGKTVLIR